MYIFLALCAALELRLPPSETPTTWRALVGQALEFEGGSLELQANASAILFQVRDTSDLRRTEVVDVQLPGKAVYADKAMVVNYPLGEGEGHPQLALVAETESWALAAAEPALFDTRVVYSAFYEWNSTWKLVARLRALHVGAQCEAPFPLPAQPNMTTGLSSIGQTAGYSGREVATALWWDHNCSAIPVEVNAAWNQRLEFAANYSAAHPARCLPAGHWHWDSGDPEWAFAEMKVLRTAPQTFYVALGFLGGYVGVQDHGEGSRYLVYSVWDESTMAEVVELGDGVEARRFSGELRGFQLTRKMEWELKTPLRFIVRSETGPEPRYTAYVYDDLYGRWDLIATVRVRPCGKPRSALGQLNSFVEVFGTQDCVTHRQADYNIWTMSGDGPWQPVTKAKLWGTFNESGLRGLIRDADFILDVGGDLPADPRFGTNFTSPEPRMPAVLRGGVGPIGRGGPAEPAGFVLRDQDAARGSILDSTWRAC